MKKRILALAAAFLVFLAGCSSNSQKEQAVSKFFAAVNQIFEAKTLDASGSLEYGSAVYPYTLQFDQTGENIELAFSVNSTSLPAAFYIKDGKTYLNYFGTKSSSVAENIGLGEGSKLNLYNPFLNLTTDERNEAFDSVTVKGDTYTYTLNTTKLSTLLDSYGSSSVTKAVMDVTYDGSQIKKLVFTFKGSVSFGSEAMELSAVLTMDINALNTDVTIDYPADLDTY